MMNAVAVALLAFASACAAQSCDTRGCNPPVVLSGFQLGGTVQVDSATPGAPAGEVAKINKGTAAAKNYFGAFTGLKIFVFGPGEADSAYESTTAAFCQVRERPGRTCMASRNAPRLTHPTNTKHDAVHGTAKPQLRQLYRGAGEVGKPTRLLLDGRYGAVQVV